MKLRIFETFHYGLRAVTCVAVIPKSKQLGILKRRQKTWTVKTVAPEFTIQEMRNSFEAEAKRWEQRMMQKYPPTPNTRLEAGGD